jgi:hypothetical protein
MSAAQKRDLPGPMNPTVYRKVNLDQLVVFALHSLLKRGLEATFENVVAEAYSLFPERFALRRFPEWPDSAVVNKSWLRCRSDEHYIVGSTRDGFRLTPKGAEVAERMAKLMQVGRPPPRRRQAELSETRTQEGRLVRSLQQSEAFRTYEATKELSHMSDYDFCETLMCTTESSPSLVRANLEQFRDACQIYGRDELVRFLHACEQRFAHLLSKADSGRYGGGMMRRRLTEEDS